LASFGKLGQYSFKGHHGAGGVVEPLTVIFAGLRDRGGGVCHHHGFQVGIGCLFEASAQIVCHRSSLVLWEQFPNRDGF